MRQNMEREKTWKEKDQTLVELKSAHCCSQANYQQAQANDIK